MPRLVSLALLLLTVPRFVSLIATDAVAKEPAFSRYQAMLDDSPFGVATAATTPSFAKDLYIANAARSPEGDMVTLASASDKNFKEYLTTKGPNEHGYTIANIEWSQSVGAPRVTISKDGHFVPGLLQNRSYWGGGKSEIDFYQAEFVRDGEPHQCELLVILTPLFVEPNTMTYLDDSKSPGAIPGIRMNQMATIPRGVAVEQRSMEALWRMDFMSLARLSFTGSDPVGNVAKTLRENRQADQVGWTYWCDSYTGKTDPQPIALGGKQTLVYDELPLRVRTLDFSKSTGEIEIDIAPSLASPQKAFGEIKPAKVSWKVGNRAIEVEVQHPAGKDRFILDANFPFLLREWIAADGMHWKMKNSIRADYRKYLRNADRERALKDPMLRHPD